MNKKQKEAMIAYRIQIAGLEENIRNLWCAINPVVDDDVVEKIEMRLSRLAAMSEGRERDTEGAFLAFKERQNLIDTRMRHRDEAIEAMGESLTLLFQKVVQLNSGVKEHDARLGFFLETTGEINKELQVVQQQMATNNSRLAKLTQLYFEMRPKKQTKKIIDWGSNTATAYQIPQPPQPAVIPSTANLLTKKTAEKARKEYKKVMKRG